MGDNNITNQTIQKVMKIQTATLTTADTGGASSSAKLYPNGRIVATISNASEKLATVTITNDFAFKVVDVFAYRTDTFAGDDAGKLSVYNNTTKIIAGSLALGTGSGQLSRCAKVTDAHTAFAKDDNDLVIKMSGSTNMAVVVVLDTVLT